MAAPLPRPRTQHGGHLGPPVRWNGSARPTVGFRPRLGLIAGAALAVRLLYTLIFARGVPVTGDALTFHLVAGRLAEGEGFFRPPAQGIPAPLGTGPTAEHPPLFEVLLAGFDLVGLDTPTAQKAGVCLVGTVTVVLIGLAGRELAGPRAGLIAAGLAAVYPMLWIADGSLMSESLYGALIAAIVLCALRFAREPTTRRALGLGVLVGLAALTRGEAILLVVLLLVPLARRQLRLAAVAVRPRWWCSRPWTVRNLIEFERPGARSRPTRGRSWPGPTAGPATRGSSPASGSCAAARPARPATSPRRRPPCGAGGSTTRATTLGACPWWWASGCCACGTSTGRCSKPTSATSRAAAATPGAWRSWPTTRC